MYVHRRNIKQLLGELKRHDIERRTISSVDELALAQGLPAASVDKEVRRPSRVLSSVGRTSFSLRRASNSGITTVEDLASEVRWLIPKFEQFEATAWMMGPVFIAVRLVQTGFAALIGRQVVRLTFVACMTLGASKNNLSRCHHSRNLEEFNLLKNAVQVQSRCTNNCVRTVDPLTIGYACFYSGLYSSGARFLCSNMRNLGNRALH